MKTTLLVATTLASLLAVSANAQSLNWNLTGSQGSGTFGNSLTFTQSSVSVKATAWGYTYSSNDNALETAALGQWSVGLGVSDRSEGANAGSPHHQVDNAGPDNWVLFEFSSPVTNASVTIQPSGTYDRDVSYFTGSSTSPLNLTSVAYSSLPGLGFASQIDDESSVSNQARTVTIQSATAFNKLLFGAKIGEPSSSYADYFKVQSVAGTVVPEPASAGLFAFAIAALGLRRSRRS